MISKSHYCGFNKQDVTLNVEGESISGEWHDFKNNTILLSGLVNNGEIYLKGNRCWQIKYQIESIKMYGPPYVKGIISEKQITGKLRASSNNYQCAAEFSLTRKFVAANTAPDLSPTQQKPPRPVYRPTPPPVSVAPPVSAPAPVPSTPPAQAQGFPQTPIDVAFRYAPSRPNDIAVVIGNANYNRKRGDIPDVVPAYADAEGVRRYVTQALGVLDGNVIFLKDASQAEFISVFGSKDNPRGRLHNWVMPGESNVYVFYSGHGAPGGGGKAYLVPVDANTATIELNGYPLETLYQNLGKLPAKSITVILEACFSGAAQAGTVINNASPVYLKARVPPVPANVTVVAAGGPDQIASWERDKSHGLFTKYFLKGMSGEADAAPHGNGDGAVGLDELERYFTRTLTYFARRYYGRDQNARIVVGGQ